MSTPKLTEVYQIQELPMFGGKPKMDPATGSQNQQTATTNVQSKLIAALKHVGEGSEIGRALGTLALDLSAILGRIPDQKFQQKVIQQWERVAANARVIGQGQRREAIDRFLEEVDRFVMEEMSKAEMENLVGKYAGIFVGKKSIDDVKPALRTVLKMVGGEGGEPAKGKGKAAGEKGSEAKPKLRNVAWKSDQQKPADQPSGSREVDLAPAAQEPAKAEPAQEPAQPKTAQAATPAKAAAAQGKAQSGPGGDVRKVRDDLLKPLKLSKMDLATGGGQNLARNMARAANTIAQNLATHPASNPQKVKNFTSAWQGLVSLVGGYMQKKPGFFQRRAQQKARMVP